MILQKEQNRVVLQRLIKINDETDELGFGQISEALDYALDELMSEDFFGTEAQNDPRGDGREEFPPRMSKVEVN